MATVTKSIIRSSGVLSTFGCFLVTGSQREAKQFCCACPLRPVIVAGTCPATMATFGQDGRNWPRGATLKARPAERSRFQPQQLRRIGLGHLHNVRLGDALRDQCFVERQQSVSMERILGLTQVG